MWISNHSQTNKQLWVIISCEIIVLIVYLKSYCENNCNYKFYIFIIFLTKVISNSIFILSSLLFLVSLNILIAVEIIILETKRVQI